MQLPQCFGDRLDTSVDRLERLLQHAHTSLQQGSLGCQRHTGGGGIGVLVRISGHHASFLGGKETVCLGRASQRSTAGAANGLAKVLTDPTCIDRAVEGVVTTPYDAAPVRGCGSDTAESPREAAGHITAPYTRLATSSPVATVLTESVILAPDS